MGTGKKRGGPNWETYESWKFVSQILSQSGQEKEPRRGGRKILGPVGLRSADNVDKLEVLAGLACDVVCGNRLRLGGVAEGEPGQGPRDGSHWVQLDAKPSVAVNASKLILPSSSEC